MFTSDYRNYEQVVFPTGNIIQDSTNHCPEAEISNKNCEPPDPSEKRILVYGSIGLSVLGLIAFLITGQVAVVLAMNAPLLAIIGRGIFSR